MQEKKELKKGFWETTNNFQKVNNPVWNKFKKNNGLIEKYYFIRYLLERGKHHPQILLSMASEYALVLFIFNAFGLVITTKTVIICTLLLLLVLIGWGYVDVYFDVARKSTSFNNRFNPEFQKLFKDVEDIKGELKRKTKKKKKK